MSNIENSSNPIYKATLYPQGDNKVNALQDNSEVTINITGATSVELFVPVKNTFGHNNLGFLLGISAGQKMGVAKNSNIIQDFTINVISILYDENSQVFSFNGDISDSARWTEGFDNQIRLNVFIFEGSVGVVGSTTLAGLTDVNIPAPTDGQVLTYDNGTSQWVASNAANDPNKVNKTGDSMSGDLVMTAPAKVQQNQAPAVGDDLTNKTYVDNAFNNVKPEADAQIIQTETLDPKTLGAQGPDVCPVSMLSYDFNYFDNGFVAGVKTFGSSYLVGGTWTLYQRAVGKAYYGRDATQPSTLNPNPVYVEVSLPAGNDGNRAGYYGSGSGGLTKTIVFIRAAGGSPNPLPYRVSFWRTFDETNTSTVTGSGLSDPIINFTTRNFNNTLLNNDKHVYKVKNLLSYASLGVAPTTTATIDPTYGPIITFSSNNATTKLNYIMTTDYGTNAYEFLYTCTLFSGSGSTVSFNPPTPWVATNAPVNWVIQNAQSQPADYTHALTNIINCAFYNYNDPPNTPITSFTQAQVSDGNIYLKITDGTLSQFSFTVTTTDTRLSVVSAARDIIVPIMTARCDVEEETKRYVNTNIQGLGLTNYAKRNNTDTGNVQIGSFGGAATTVDLNVTAGTAISCYDGVQINANGNAAVEISALGPNNQNSIILRTQSDPASIVQIIPAGITDLQYANNLTLDSSVPNKIYVDNAITAAAPDLTPYVLKDGTNTGAVTVGTTNDSTVVSAADDVTLISTGGGAIELKTSSSLGIGAPATTNILTVTTSGNGNFLTLAGYTAPNATSLVNRSIVESGTMTLTNKTLSTNTNTLTTSRIYGYMDGNATSSGGTQNVYNWIQGTITTSLLNNFTFGANNTITYTGTTTKNFKITFSGAPTVGSNDRTCYFIFIKNPAVLTTPATAPPANPTGYIAGSRAVSTLRTAVNDTDGISGLFTVSLATNDTLRAYCANVENNDAITVNDWRFAIEEIL